MSNRRSVLRGLLSAPFVAKAGSAKIAKAAIEPGPDPVKMMVERELPSNISGPIGLVSDGSSLWDTFHNALSHDREGWNLRRNRRLMCGGIDHDIASNVSWSPAYKAMKMAIRLRDQEREEDGIVAALKRKIGLPT